MTLVEYFHHPRTEMWELTKHYVRTSYLVQNLLNQLLYVLCEVWFLRQLFTCSQGNLFPARDNGYHGAADFIMKSLWLFLLICLHAFHAILYSILNINKWVSQLSRYKVKQSGGWAAGPKVLLHCSGFSGNLFLSFESNSIQSLDSIGWWVRCATILSLMAVM